jgi:hypothetical protein
MKTRVAPTAAFLALLCGPALAQQANGIAKTKPATTVRGPSMTTPATGSIGGRMMLKPGQASIGGKTTGQ